MYRWQYDPGEHVLAARLDADTVNWHVWYGVGSRRFFAVPSWQSTPVLIVNAHDAVELVQVMYRVEADLPVPSERAGMLPHKCSLPYVSPPGRLLPAGQAESGNPERQSSSDGFATHH